MTETTSCLPAPQTWNEARNLAVCALKGQLAYLKRVKSGRQLTAGRPRKPVIDHARIMCDTAVRNVLWASQQYFIVIGDADPDNQEERLYVDLHRFEGQRLFFCISEDVRSHLGRMNAAGIHFYYIDDIEIQLKTRLLQVLKATREGPLVPQLWRPNESLWLERPNFENQGFNADQERAFAALTSKGAFFIWGPPGTGKTKVISAAVADALQHRRSVLVTSHTHIAVDNVLEKLIDSLPSPGILIRIPPVDREKISPRVSGQGTLLLDQAAAVLTNHKERLKAHAEKERECREHHDAVATELSRVTTELEQVDEVQIEAAEHAGAATSKVDHLKEHLTKVLREARETERSRAALAAEAGRLAFPDDFRREELEGQLSKMLVAESKAQELLTRLGSEHDALEHHRSFTQEQRTTVFSRAQDMSAVRRMFGLHRSHVKRANTLADELRGLARELQQSHQGRRQAERRLSSFHDSVKRAKEALTEHMLASEEHAQAQQRLMGASSKARQLRSRLEDIQQKLDQLLQRGSPINEGGDTEPQDFYAKKLRMTLNRREALNTELKEIQERQCQLENERRRIEDDFRSKRNDLLRNAPVIACTLTALMFNPVLAKRSFDVVIVDEVANANAASVLYAAAKGTRAVALVGDFLQNAPIAETDDPVGDLDKTSIAWQREDIFALAGITNKDSALAHGHCIPLSLQYRYPSIVADIVNSFCYEGLLDSHRHSAKEDGLTVIFVDTSQVLNYPLIKQNGSWWSPGGLALMVALAHRHPRCQLGFVTPYSAQAKLAEAEAKAKGLAIECGTAHRFQGKEVSVLIFDLMQDKMDRWVGAADLGAGRRGVSAAKLLNVALTRMQQRIYLIGDWSYVQSSHRPGMRAIAAQDGKPNFGRLSGKDLL